ncbi:MAG: heavy metal-binding domain-containing protein [Fimbriimonadaceae bacterium]|nr:heavy metal-binding domain-containing protein [Fimbriimonadaceae bacterium]
MAIMTGLSGNEMFCLAKKGFTPGNLVIGNSVYSVGFVGSLGSAFRTIAGGEVEQITSIVHDGRQASYERMIAWTDLHGAIGITGVTSELVLHSGNVEFLSIGSCVHQEGLNATHIDWSASADGQELYCQIDAGFHPRKFVFGNVAYSIGLGGGIAGAFRGLGRGEVHEYSEVFNKTRHLALQRITAEAVSAGANAVVGINTSIIPFQGMQEMVMIGTAARHPLLPPEYDQTPITSDLTNEEMWNLVHMGYMPLQLVLGVSVYSLGFVGGVKAVFKSLVRGEINELTTLIYEARENAVAHLTRDADACGADDVVGIKTYVYEVGSGMIEFMAIGTAVKRWPGLTTVNDSLPPQAVIADKDTFINTAEKSVGKNLNETKMR